MTTNVVSRVQSTIFGQTDVACSICGTCALCVLSGIKHVSGPLCAHGAAGSASGPSGGPGSRLVFETSRWSLRASDARDQSPPSLCEGRVSLATATHHTFFFSCKPLEGAAQPGTRTGRAERAPRHRRLAVTLQCSAWCSVVSLSAIGHGSGSVCSFVVNPRF